MIALPNQQDKRTNIFLSVDFVGRSSRRKLAPTSAVAIFSGGADPSTNLVACSNFNTPCGPK